MPSSLDLSLAVKLTLLQIEGLGSQTLSYLLKHFESPADILKTNENFLSTVPRLPKKTALEILSLKNFDKGFLELEFAHQNGIAILTSDDVHYPRLLKETIGAPALLFVKGNPAVLNELTWLGIVGSRKPTPYGFQVIEKLIPPLVEAGLGIVSGFALGIDIAAHTQTLRSGGTTIGVLGSGLGCVYPASNRRYVDEVLERGALVTEHGFNVMARPEFFPRRNRIISGMSRGILVAEAKKKSGALITSNYALEQGRDVFSVPGSIFSELSEGTLQIIRQGAIPVTSAQDILEEWGMPLGEKKLLHLLPEEKLLLSLCRGRSLTLDEIIQSSGFSVPEASLHLTSLELKGHIKNLPGSRFESL